jgi:hypothetical protein
MFRKAIHETQQRQERGIYAASMSAPQKLGNIPNVL